jgi:hypothetical protein
MKARVESILLEIGAVKQALRLHSVPGDSTSNTERNEDEGDLGFLADIFQWENVEGSRYTVAMDAIIGSQLAVRICKNGDAASRLMKRAQTSQQVCVYIN